MIIEQEPNPEDSRVREAIRSLIERNRPLLRENLGIFPSGFVVELVDPSIIISTEFDFFAAIGERMKEEEREAMEVGALNVNPRLGWLSIVSNVDSEEITLDYRPRRHQYYLISGSPFQLRTGEKMEISGGVTPQEVYEKLLLFFNERGGFRKNPEGIHAGEFKSLGFYDKYGRRLSGETHTDENSRIFWILFNTQRAIGRISPELLRKMTMFLIAAERRSFRWK